MYSKLVFRFRKPQPQTVNKLSMVYKVLTLREIVSSLLRMYGTAKVYSSREFDEHNGNFEKLVDQPQPCPEKS